MRTQTLSVAMNSVARASGYATAAVNEHKKAVMDMGIAEQESMQIMTRFMQARLDTADASRLARVAQDAAVIANMNSSQAAEQMTEAIAKQRPILLSQFGMTRNLNEIYKDYASTLGKTTTQLTEAEKKQAMLNYILEEGDKIAGTYEASMGAVGKQIGSLPRYYDTLKNALATPLALPGLSVAVEGITNALKSAIAWAEANEATLRVWGQNVANIVSGVVTAFSWITRTLSQNWQMIKLAGTALVSYAAATKIVTGAVGLWKAANLLLNGTLVTKIPLLSTTSKAIGIYRAQMALAPVATNMFTGALLKLRVGLHAVHAAIGPVGWAILALSAILTGGMILWNKYNENANDMSDIDEEFAEINQGLADSLEEIDDSMQGMEDSSTGAAKGQEDLGEEVGKAAKAAQKALAPFDELNILQKNMGSGGGGSGGGVPSLGGMGDPLAGLNFKMPTIDTKEVEKEIDKSKRKWEGFLIWLGDWWDGLKQTFSLPITVPAPVFARIPSPVYTPEWNLNPPLIPTPIFPPINYKGYNQSLETVKRLMRQTRTALETVHQGLVESLTRQTTTGSRNIQTALNGAWDTRERNFQTHRGKILGTATALGTGLYTSMNNASNRVRNGLSTAWSTIETNYNTHRANVGAIATAVGATMAVNVSRGLSTMGRNVNNAIYTVQNNLNTFGRGVGSVAAEVGRTFSYNISQGFNTAIRNFSSFVRGMGSNIRAFGSGMLSGALQTARGFVSNLVSGFQTVWNNFRNLMSGMGERVGGWFSANRSVIGKVAIGAGIAVGVGAIALAAPAALPFAAKAVGGLAAIPMLAEGAVIDPNDEFLAILGDQKSGRNIETPERLLRQIMQEELKNKTSSSGETPIELTINLGDKKIYHEIINGINQASRQAGKTLINI